MFEGRLRLNEHRGKKSLHGFALDDFRDDFVEPAIAVRHDLPMPSCGRAMPLEIAARCHSEGDEEICLHVCVEVCDTDPDAVIKRLAVLRGHSADELRHDGLQVAVAFARIVPALPRCEVNRQRRNRIPADRILVETDCPYLAPIPHRGRRNEPSFVADTARFIAALREIPLRSSPNKRPRISIDSFTSEHSKHAPRFVLLPVCSCK